MSEILGNGIPQFIGTGTPDTTTRILYYATLTDLSLSEDISSLNESVINYLRTNDYLGRHATIIATVLLGLFTSNPKGYTGLPTAKSFFNTLMTYEHKDVKLHLSTNGPCFKNTDGDDITLYIESIAWDCDVKEGLIGDKAIITFKTNEPYDITRLVIT